MDQEPTAPSRKKSPARRAKKWLVTLSLIALICIPSLVCAASAINKPVEGKIINAKKPTETTPEPTEKQLTTPYYTTRYSGRYEVAPEPTNSASLNAQILRVHQQANFGTRSRITLTVAQLADGGVTEDSAYKLYESQTDLYALTPQRLNGEEVIVAVRTSPSYEKIILWPHDNHLLTIILSVGSESATAQNDLQTVLRNLRWQ